MPKYPNGVQAGSVLALSGDLKSNPGDEVTIAATGPQSRNALDAVEAELTGKTASSAKESFPGGAARRGSLFTGFPG